MLLSSGVIGDGSLSKTALNLIVPVVGEKSMADRSRARCASRIDASLLLSLSAPMLDAKVEMNSSREKIRDVFEFAIADALSSTALAAA